jgi:hypothetical protein
VFPVGNVIPRPVLVALPLAATREHAREGGIDKVVLIRLRVVASVPEFVVILDSQLGCQFDQRASCGRVEWVAEDWSAARISDNGDD